MNLLRAIIWRGSLFALGLVWLAVVVGDVHEMIVHGGLFAWTFGVVHALVFLFMGLAACLLALLADTASAREALVEFARDVFGWKNLLHVSTTFLIAILAALVLVAIGS